MTEENEAFNDDILSAALSEAGLEEFFEPPSAAASTNSSNCFDDGDDAPTEVLCEEIVRTGFPPPPPPSLSGLNRSNQSTELASPATASTGTSPDLPVETISRPSTSSTMDSVQKSPVVTSTPSSPNTSASSMHNYYNTTRPPTKTSNNNIIIKHSANQLNTPSSIATGSTSSAAATSGTRYIKYVTPEGKMLLLPVSSIQQHGLQSPIVRLVYASKTAPTSTTPSASAAPRHLNPVIINNAPRVTNNMVMPPPVLEPILPVFRRVAPHYNKNLRIVPPPPSAASRFGLPAPRHAPHPNPSFSSSFASRRLGRGGSSTTGGATVGGGSKRNVTFSQMVVDVEEEFNRRYSSSSATRLPTVSHVTSSSMSTSSMSMPTSFGVDNEVTVASAAPPGGKTGGGSQQRSQQQANAFVDQQFFEPAGVYADPTRFANKFHHMDKDKENPMIRLIPLDLRPKSSMTSSTPTSLASSTTDVKKVEPASMSSVTLEDPEEEEDLGHAETYSEYTPAKLRSGLNHPDPVVETSSLSSVTPPDIFYHFTIPEYLVDTGKLSALQLEAIIYACQQHENFNPNRERVGYLIGDGAGVGKGRTIAGLIYENYLLGRKRALWFSVSSDLKYDAERDLADIGAEKIKVHALNKFKYMRISGKENGGVKKGVIFATYSSLIGESNNAKSKYRSRLKQLIHWCGGKDFEGLIVFDECHRAKNLVPTGTTKPTKTGQIVLEIQKELPKARVVYASATGATETRNMAYMTRLGLWGPGKPFKDFTDFITAVEKRGVGAMEIVAMDMKQRGLYLARQLSFAGTSFRIEEVPLSLEFILMYDESVKLWLEARKQFQRASELVGAERGDRKSMWGQFWASHQRFFKYLCIAAKVSACVRMAREAVKNGKCVVIGLQSTGEARTLEQLEECGGELNEFVSTAKGVFMSLIEKHFPMSDNSNEINLKNLTTKEARHSLFGDMGDLFGDDKKRSYKRRASERFNNAAKRSKRDALTKRLSSSDNTDDDDSDKESSSRDKSKSDKDESTSTSNDEDSDKDSDKQSQSSSGSESDSSSIVSNERESDDEENERFNPFADEEEEQDPWEFKIKKSQKKKSKKRKKPTKEDLEEVDELGKQLEEAMEERIVEKQSQVKEVAIDVDDFLHTTSTFLDPSCSSSNRFDASLGLSEVNVKKAELLSAVERLGDLLPANTLDQLIDDLGGPEYVAEMTGRKGRVVTRDDGEIQYELRNEVDVPLELLNLAEKERFMKGEKHIAIISEAASSGISLQSDRRAKNQRRRVHITLELPWSADKAIQQFGRTHRSNQVNAPEYVFLISELAGEQRFASVVAKRLESLGALTHGDRRATESRDLSQFNLDTKYGRVALDVTLKSILGHSAPVVKPSADYKGNFFIDMRQYMEGVGIAGRSLEDNNIWMVEKDMNMAKFLNRILGLPVYAQNALFQYFSDTLKAVVEEAKKDGRYDMGIMDLGSGREKVKKVETRVFIGKFDAGGYKTELHLVAVERGMSWDEAMDLYTEHAGSDDGFYVSSNSSVKPTAVFICAIARRRLESNERLFNVYRPNTGLNITMETLTELRHRYKKILPDAAERIWKEQYDISESRCQHVFWFGKCRNELAGLTCEVGKRKRSYYILSGSVLSVWNSVEHILTSGSSIGKRLGKMQVVRVRTDQDQKIVGILVPNTFVRAVVDRLSEESSRTYVETFR